MLISEQNCSGYDDKNISGWVPLNEIRNKIKILKTKTQSKLAPEVTQIQSLKHRWSAGRGAQSYSD